MKTAGSVGTAESPGAVGQTPATRPWLPGEEDLLAAPFSEYRHLKWWFRRRIPWTLWRYICLEVLRVMLLSVLTVSLLYSAVAAFQIVRSGIQLSFIWPFLAKTIAYPLYFSIPLALLFGVTLAMGRMVLDLEVVAMRTHGASHAQLFAPVIFLGLVSAVASYALNGWVVPELHYEKRNLQQYIVKQIENLGSGRNRTILLPGGGGSLLVRAYKGTELLHVEVDLNRTLQSRFVPEVRGQLPQRLPEKVTIVAKRGRLQIPENRRGVVIHLRGVEILIPEKAVGGERFHQRFTITQTLSIPLSFEKKPPGIKDLSQPELAARIRQLEEQLSETPDDGTVAAGLDTALTEKHRRLAFLFSCITFPFIGCCLCLLLARRGKLAAFFIGNVVVIAMFYPLLMVGSSLGERGFAPGLALALPNLALAALGFHLVKKVIRQ